MCNICISWDSNISANIAAILLDEMGYVSDSKDIIFPNQSNTNRGVQIAGEPLFGENKTPTNELVFVNYDLLPNSTTEIKFILYANEPLSTIKELSILITDNNEQPFSSIQIPCQFNNEYCFEIFSLVFENGIWEIKESRKSYKQSFNSLLLDYFQL